MRILFQGDSITDASRVREKDDDVGCGYPLLVKAQLGLQNPGKYEFINRGISGDRVVDLYARMEGHIFCVNPDILSILVGVNDVWRNLSPTPTGVNPEKYFKIYDMLVGEVREKLPDCKIMILEPFVLKGEATIEKWENFESEVKNMAEMSRKISEKYNITYVYLQEGFNELSKKAPAEYWLRDGVHPTSMGHEYIKNQWIDAFNKIKW